jgi:hypothetical protein
MHSRGTIQEIMEITGGWPILLNSFFNRSGTKAPLILLSD